MPRLGRVGLHLPQWGELTEAPLEQPGFRARRQHHAGWSAFVDEFEQGVDERPAIEHYPVWKG